MEQNPNQEKESAPRPVASDVSIRTMELDEKALEQGGGEMGAPQTFTPEGVKDGQPRFDIPGYVGPEKSIFVQSRQSFESEVGSSQKNSGRLKLILIIILVAIIIVGLGFLAYFAATHWVFPKQMPSV